MKQNFAKIAFVTGANQGIGFAAVKTLAKKQPNTLVYLGSRDLNRGKEAAKKLAEEGLHNISVVRLDVCDEKTIKEAADTIKTKHEGLDILINNAGIMYSSKEFDENVVRTTLTVNYFGMLTMFNHFVPLMKDKGRIVNVSSSLGIVDASIYKAELIRQLNNPKLTIDEVSTLMNTFIQDVKEDKYAERGWPKSAYRISKVGVNALTSIYAKKFEEQDNNNNKKEVMVVSCCPGWVRTNLTGFMGRKTPEEGADTPVWLATDAYFVCGDGKCYEERSVITWLPKL